MLSGFGFQQSQAEKDAWEVKAYQDSLASRVADHHNALGEEGYDVDEEKNAGGHKQNYRAFLLAFAAYMGWVTGDSLFLEHRVETKALFHGVFSFANRQYRPLRL